MSEPESEVLPLHYRAFSFLFSFCVTIANIIADIMTDHHFLIIDDDWQLVDRLKTVLAANLSATIDATPTLEQAREQIARHYYSMVMMERFLPDGDSLSLLTQQLNYNDQTQYLIWSNSYLLKEREEGLRAGALDYLAKPFSMLELVIKLQRYSSQQYYHNFKQELVFIKPGLKFLPQRQQLIVDNTICHLTASDKQILQTLLTHSGRIISYEVLIDALASNECQSTGALRVRVHRLRAKLGRFKDLIENCHQLGYCFNLTSKPKVISKIA